jgi:hypothetical protein
MKDEVCVYSSNSNPEPSCRCVDTGKCLSVTLVYYESRKRELKTRPISKTYIFCLFISCIWGLSQKVFYYESRKRELKTRFIYEDRCDERLKARVKLRNLHASHALGCAIPAVIHT